MNETKIEKNWIKKITEEIMRMKNIKNENRLKINTNGK